MSDLRHHRPQKDFAIRDFSVSPIIGCVKKNLEIKVRSINSLISKSRMQRFKNQPFIVSETIEISIIQRFVDRIHDKQDKFIDIILGICEPICMAELKYLQDINNSFQEMKRIMELLNLFGAWYLFSSNIKCIQIVDLFQCPFEKISNWIINLIHELRVFLVITLDKFDTNPILTKPQNKKESEAQIDENLSDVSIDSYDEEGQENHQELDENEQEKLLNEISMIDQEKYLAKSQSRKNIISNIKELFHDIIHNVQIQVQFHEEIENGQWTCEAKVHQNQEIFKLKRHSNTKKEFAKTQVMVAILEQATPFLLQQVYSLWGLDTKMLLLQNGKFQSDIVQTSTKKNDLQKQYKLVLQGIECGIQDQNFGNIYLDYTKNNLQDGSQRRRIKIIINKILEYLKSQLKHLKLFQSVELDDGVIVAKVTYRENNQTDLHHIAQFEDIIEGHLIGSFSNLRFIIQDILKLDTTKLENLTSQLSALIV